MKKNRFDKSFVYLILFLQISLIYISCNINSPDQLMILVKGDSFKISWDDDSSKISNFVYKAVKYNVYYRIHGTVYWRFLGSSVNTSFTVSSEILDYGIYDLGVSSVSSSGLESEIHSSLDMTAEPFCGWYIQWIGSK